MMNMTAMSAYIPTLRQLMRCTNTGVLRHTNSVRCVCSPPVTACIVQPWNQMQLRNYWNKRAPRSPATKPLSFDYSGDLSASIGNIDFNQPKLGFEGLPEYESADENVKKIVSLKFSSRSDIVDKVIKDLINRVKDHPLDVKSTEYHIAKETVLIRNQIQHCLKFRNDKISKTMLIERIHHRKKTLKQLRRRDIEKFNWLTSELQLQVMPDPPPAKVRLSKREKREEAARQASAAIISRKNEELRKRLAAEKEAFDEYREAELADIEKSLKELGIGEIQSFEQTLAALGASDLLPASGPKESRHRRRLAMRFALYGEEKKRKDAEILRAHGFIVPKSLLTPSSVRS